MNLRISFALVAWLLAAFGALAPATRPNPIEGARLNNLGVAYMNQQLFEKGLKSFQQAAEADPKLAIARLNQGIAYLNLQKVDEAKAAFEDVLKQDPKNATAWYGLGMLAKNSGEAAAAVDAFKHVIEIDPADADTWYFLGTAYGQAKQFPPAIEAFEHALKINPLHASAEFGLSRAYQQSTDVDQAREHLKKFQYITQNKIGAPMSLAYGEQGQYSRAVESPQAAMKAPAQIKVRFVNATAEAGIAAHAPTSDSGRGLGPGACFLDYDGDGLPDLFLPDAGAGMRLYRNVGKGRFEDVTEKAMLDPKLHAVSCTAGDYDNDSAPDLAVGLPGRVLLLHNEKNGTFKDVTGESGIKGQIVSDISSLPVEPGLAFIDYDHDGDIDLYITADTTPRPWSEGNPASQESGPAGRLWRNNGDHTFTDVTGAVGLAGSPDSTLAIGTDYNNDRAVDLVVTGIQPTIYENPREGHFIQKLFWKGYAPHPAIAVSVLDFDHDGWMDLAFTHTSAPGITLWRNNHAKSFEQVKLPETGWVRAYGVAAFDYDNDGWVDLIAVGETKDGKGEIRLFRNLGPDGFKDVTSDVGLDKIELKDPRAIIIGDYDGDGATDLLITQNHGPAVLLRNEGGNQNHWLRLSLKGLNDNKSAVGTKVEVFSGGNRQKFEIYGSNGYLGQNSADIIVGLGESKDADIVRMLWPTGVLQDEIQVVGDKQQNILEIDRRGSSCPTLFAWNGERYQFVADMLGAGVVGHWIAPGQRDIPRPVEFIKLNRNAIREKNDESGVRPRTSELSKISLSAVHRQKSDGGFLSFRFMEPLEEAVYLDQVRLMAVDHPADVDVYPNEYFASNPPYPPFKVVMSRDARPPAGAWDEHGHNLLPDLLARHYVGDFALTQFAGFAKPHSLTLDLGKAHNGGPLWLLMHGEIEYFSASSMYAASQAGLEPIAPYVEALDALGNWRRVISDMGFPAGGPRTMTADLTGKLPRGTRQIRITTNLQVYWDNILIDRTPQSALGGISRLAGKSAGLVKDANAEEGREAVARGHMQSDVEDREVRLTTVPLVRADLEFHGYPFKIEGTPPGNVEYIYEKASATGPYTRPSGTYTRYGDVLPLLKTKDDKLAVFGSGDEVQLDFDPAHLPGLPRGWVRDYFFAANGYEKDMDFYAAEGNYVAPLPFMSMGEYPYSARKSFPLDDAHVNYLLEFNTRHMSGNEQRGYWFDYGSQ